MSFKASESVVVECFQLYYYEILRQKEAALLSNKELIDNEQNKKDKLNALIFNMQKKLVATLDISINSIKQNGRLSASTLDEIKYMLTIFTDEVFLTTNWNGAQYWSSLLMERQLFSSEVAGDKFFTMLDETIDNHSNVSDDMVYLYFMMLSLGFKGKFRDTKTAYNEIAMYKDRLYNIFHNKPSRLFYPGRQFLIEDCYASIYHEANNSKMQDTVFWRWFFRLTIIAFLIISTIIWIIVTSDIGSILNEIAESVSGNSII